MIYMNKQKLAVTFFFVLRVTLSSENFKIIFNIVQVLIMCDLKLNNSEAIFEQNTIWNE